jgi:hypothetical protein
MPKLNGSFWDTYWRSGSALRTLTWVLPLSVIHSSCGGRAAQGPGLAVEDAATPESSLGESAMGNSREMDGGTVTEAAVTREAGWASGESCLQGGAIQFVEQRDAGYCTVACECLVGGVLQCTTRCNSIPPPSEPACTEGASCSNQACDSNLLSGPSSCVTGCACDPTGHYRCARVCPNDCGFPRQPPTCSICKDGTVACQHFVLFNGACAEQICPGDGIIRGG